MSRVLVDSIAEQTEILLFNVNTMLGTCNMDIVLCDMPVWKHVYHMLHSLDQWFVNPNRYIEPQFHESGLNSLDLKSDRVLSREGLLAYFKGIEAKITHYLLDLTDEMLSDKPENCEYTRLALILGQYRHLYCHLGIINGTTIQATGRWPRVVGMDADFTMAYSLFE